MRTIRRNRRRNNFRQKTRVNFTAIVVIISIAVLLGYGTTKFVIYPLINLDLGKIDSQNSEQQKPQQNTQQNLDVVVTGGGVEQAPQEVKQQKGIVEDQLEVKKTEIDSVEQTTAKQSGYCIQFGSFSTKPSAENLVSQLKTGGITAEVIEKDGLFKVVSQLFEQKEQAVATANALVGSQFADAFITER